ncbi:MAG: ergothioneine biosynthesis protein EgtB [Sneathiella sp.]
MTTNIQTTSDISARRDEIGTLYKNTRDRSLSLTSSLSDADTTVQSMPDASPAKWHLGHTTWFFETLVLIPYFPSYVPFDNSYHFLFNSYYESLGPRQPRPKRGMLTRPDLSKICDYRRYVDQHLDQLTSQDTCPSAAIPLIELGIHHELQHQELLLTDILHLFSQNPIRPAYQSPEPLAVSNSPLSPTNWVEFEGGILDIGHAGNTFSFDCETPEHKQIIRPFKLASKPVTNREWLSFMEEDGYKNPLYWLSDGWATVQKEEWQSPLYWEQEDEIWNAMTLRGFQPVDLDAPVSHISYFEADAFARWSGKRLPTEFEWEIASQAVELTGNLSERQHLKPKAATGKDDGLQQMFGDVWEWTSSPYISYPGFKPATGAISEYNGKFMSGQFVLKGGACTTPQAQMRKSYRNFFYPHQKWQFTGLRLAEDM